ncbi:conserved hypothetical protein [Hyphomicrobium denitrificans ATCC 51888]|uniref:Methyltransferase n=1 Tax=Hyphomicrobium denitrificans (strain ATCC 51888 / DSM 1869 / NCIMB 11706 / TK 0415) TaxID=582899 RepID=D8JVV3_HYPDA|nr:hypothetical protein [Hyphomicrobium denitrificans]ADJ22992.1 conserved hypothetical protein [Hyphomicrobium denitrificans ATCC 51888]
MKAVAIKASKKALGKDKAKKPKAMPKNHRAVMASRREPPDSLEFFPTGPWATRAFCVHVLMNHCGIDLSTKKYWEPAAGEGHMHEVLGEFFAEGYASDVFDYGRGYAQGAFVVEKTGLVDDLARCPFRPHWIVTNPPFSLAEQFVIRALQEATEGVAIVMPMRWLEGIGRYENIFSVIPPTLIAISVERIPMHKGVWLPDGDTATSYIWFVWEKRRGGRTDTIWIPPGQRNSLEHPDDRRRFGPPVGADMFQEAP